MRLWKLKLTNYIGIYNGMGINEISIDFSKCKNSVIVIKGDNGSGKSTIFKALNPFTDPSSSLIPGLKASKYIAYRLNNGNIIHITYVYPVNDRGDRKVSTCTIKLETPEGIQDINPNKNINEGKAAICRLLDIDSGFLTLAQLSSEDRGLADKKPTERKMFINKKISELDAYNEIYKKLTKKSMELKGTVQSLSNKISAIGDIRSIKQNLDISEKRLSDLEENKISIVAEMSKNKTLYDEIVSKYNDPISMHNKIMSSISQLENKRNSIPQFDRDIAVKTDEATQCESKANGLKIVIQNLFSDIQTTVTRKEAIIKNITDKKSSLESIGNVSLINNYTDKLKELKTQHDAYISYLSKLPEFVLSLTEEEYDYAVKAATDISNMVEDIKEKYSFDTIEETINLIGSASIEQYSQADIDSLRKAISHYEEEINRQNLLQEQASAYDKIPKDCPHKNSCPFVMNITKAKKDMKNSFDYSSLVSMKEKYEAMLKETLDGLQKQQNASSCKNDINMILSSAKLYMKYLIKFDTSIDLKNDKTIVRSLLGHGKIIDTNLYNEYRNTFFLLKGVETDIDTISSKLNSLKQNDAAINILTNDIDRLQNELLEVNKKLDEMNNKLDSINNEILENERKANIIRSYNSLMIEYDGISKEIEEKQNELSSIDDAYSKATEYSDKIDSLQAKVDSLFDEIKSVKSIIEENKYKAILYNDYTNEYNKYNAEFDKYETIRHYCSPTTGIQTVFMEMYMNSVIGISNQLLSMFFGGEYVLQPFVVNEKEFRMPVLGSGILNDDISSMSTSQICMISMILSFSLLHQSSSVYNIIKIDELEGGLDTQNRLNFFSVLSSLMNNLNFEQCVMISHNAELNMNNMDVIILKNTDPDFNMEGNIIFDLQNMK